MNLTTKKISDSEGQVQLTPSQLPSSHYLMLDGEYFAQVGKNKYGMYIANRLIDGGAKIESVGFGRTLKALKESVASKDDIHVFAN